MAAAVESPAGSAELERLFLAHHARVLKAAYRITGSLADAEDVAQSVFLRIAQRGDCGVAIQSPHSYVYRAAINAALDLLRRRAREGTIPLEAAAAGTVPAKADSGELRRWLRVALAKLAPKAAEVFVLRYVEDYDNSEIARMLNTSKAVVAVMLYRTRARLRRDFRDYMRGNR